MDASRIAARIYDNLAWAAAFGRTSIGAPGDVWAQVLRAWKEPDEPFVSFLYLILLGRLADAEGLNALRAGLAAGASRAMVVRQLALSEEARSRGLDVSWLPQLAVLDTTDVWQSVHVLWGAADRPFVEGLYRALLGRPADAAGRKGFCAALASGLPRAEVVRRLALSEEAKSCGLDVSWLSHLETLPAERTAPRPRPSLLSVRSLIRRWLGQRRVPNPRPTPAVVRPRPAAAAVALKQAT